MTVRYAASTYRRAAANVLSAALPVAASSLLGRFGQYAYNRATMPPVRMRRRRVSYPARRRRSVRKFRRARARVRRGRRQIRNGYNYVDKKFGRNRRLNPMLNTRMLRNDYDSVRVVFRKTNFSLTNIGESNTRLDFKIGESPLALTKLLDYDEYKITNVQWVFEPRYVTTQNFGGVAYGSLPFLLVNNRAHNTIPIGSSSYDDARRSPGWRWIPIRKLTPTVLNSTPFYEPDEISDTGTNINTVLKKLNWIHNPDTVYNPSNHPSVCPIDVIGPQLAAIDSVDWTISVYATIYYRGLRSTLITPD